MLKFLNSMRSVIGIVMLSTSLLSLSAPAARAPKKSGRPYSHKGRIHRDNKYNHAERGNRARAHASRNDAKNSNSNRNAIDNHPEARIEETPLTANVTSPQSADQNQFALNTCECINAVNVPSLPPVVVIAAGFAFIASPTAEDVADNNPVLFPNPAQQQDIGFEGDAGAFIIQEAGTYLIEFTVRGLGIGDGGPVVDQPLIFALTRNQTLIPGALFASELETTDAISGKARTITGHVTIELQAADQIQLFNRSGFTFRPGSLAAGSDNVTTESLRITQKPAAALEP